MSRLDFAPIPDTAWPEDLAGMAAGFATQLNVYRVMAHNPGLLSSWAALREHVVLKSSVPARDREVVILRAAHLWQVDYEWTHHVERGKAVGLTDAAIEAIKAGPEKGGLAVLDRILVQATDELVQDGRVSEHTLDAMAAHYSKAQIIDVIATLGMYRTLAYLISSLSVPLEAGIQSLMGRSTPFAPPPAAPATSPPA